MAGVVSGLDGEVVHTPAAGPWPTGVPMWIGLTAATNIG